MSSMSGSHDRKPYNRWWRASLWQILLIFRSPSAPALVVHRDGAIDSPILKGDPKFPGVSEGALYHDGRVSEPYVPPAIARNRTIFESMPGNLPFVYLKVCRICTISAYTVVKIRSNWSSI